MISFACAGCGHKLQVPNEVAGKSVRCSLCKHVMILAAPVAAAAAMDLPSLDGQPSSLARAGYDGGVTVGSQADSADSAPTNSANPRSLQEHLRNGTSRGERYQAAGEIARGGMGAVLRAVDCDIRREVAVKYLLDQSDPRKKARFVEEAQITGQLEHPNIVPIHELGIDAENRLFFSMKMVRGRSLQQVLADLRDYPRTTEKEYTLSRLLNLFVNVCHALAYAHSRGVVHRDLKPANIMLGDFGEVYVMDWGLAKVLQRRDAEASSSVIGTAPSFDWAQQTNHSAAAGSVQTSRLDCDDQTVDGTVMGTAMYMPPEQANGNLAAIDRRSDIYSLGAVLYEILTLHPPVDRQGGIRAVLLRVQMGEIVPPAQREPARARAGKIPPELAAVAMKALAKKQEDRYQTVEELRGDIERFREGRSVSVKEDSKREAFLKFVKRNKGFSVGAAAALLVLLVSSIFLFQSWLATRRAYAAYQKEQQDKRAQARQSVPAFVEAARVAVQRRKFDDALAQLIVAVDYDPENAAARLLKGQVLAARKEFATARPELERYLKSQPEDIQAARLTRLCAHNRPDDPAAIVELADILLRQDLPTLAEGLLSAPEKLLAVYRHKIESAWPGCGNLLAMDKDGRLSLNVSNVKQVLNLTPLQGMPFRTLVLENLPVRDLTPLKGMPLTYLDLNGCNHITDLKPLQGLPLTHLDVRGCREVAHLKALAGMPLTHLNIGGCLQIKNLSPLKGMKLTFLGIAGCEQINSLRPLQNMPLVNLEMSSCPRIDDFTLVQRLPLKDLSFQQCPQITDLTFLKGMTLSRVSFGYSEQLTDLTPLKSLPLTELSIICCAVEDLKPLKGKQLTLLSFNSCGNVEDLSPLRDMPLTQLTLAGCGKVTDLSPLKGMKLTELNISGCTRISDLSPLTGMKLRTLSLEGFSELADLTPLRGMPLVQLRLRDCGNITDLTPLDGLKLADVSFSPRTVQKGVGILRRMASLTRINDMLTAEFWKKYDAGEYP